MAKNENMEEAAAKVETEVKATAKKAAPKAEAAVEKAEKPEKAAKAAKPAAAKTDKAAKKGKEAPAAAARAFTETPRLKRKYAEEVAPALKEKFHYANVMQIPKLEKVIINMGLGSDKENPKGIEAAIKELSTIAGQKAVATRAKKSVANFKVREGMTIGAKVTLRGDRM